MNQRVLNVVMICVSIGAGALVNYLGDRLLGVRLEYFMGPYTFSAAWILDLFLVPVFAGLTVSLIYGLGGKLWCYFSPLIVRVVSYLDAVYGSGVPDGVMLLPVPYWILLVIVAIEAAAIGGVFGEIVAKKTYGRRPRHLVYKKKAATTEVGENDAA